MFNPLSIFKRAETDPNLDPLSNFWYEPTSHATPAGINVTADKAMRVSAVYGCMRILRESAGYMPFNVFMRTDEDSSEKARDHYLWRVLHERPNHWQTPQAWKELGVNHLLMRGNFYCLIKGSGEDMALWPLNPDRMTVKQLDNGRLVYTYRTKSGEPIEYAQEDIYHVVGQTLNGVNGVSVLEYARNTVGSTIAQETHGASLFRNGGLPAFWIFRPSGRPWTDTAQKNFRRGWRRMHGGAENAGNPPIFSDGMELRELKLNNKDSQWMESRGLSAEEICRFFGVPPHMIGVKSTAPKSSTEQQSQEFLMYTLTPLAARFEQAANAALLLDDDKYYTKFNLDALRRADTKSRHEAHNIAVQGGWKTINEVRALEDLNPVEGGNEVRFPMNMQPAGGGPDENEQGGQPGKGQPKPPAAPPRQDNAARASFAILLDEAAERIAAAEIKALSVRADKAAEDYQKWAEWLPDMYKKQCIYAMKTLEPICQAWANATDANKDINPEHLAVTLYLPDGLLSSISPGADIPALLETWKTTRAGELAAILKKEFFENENL